MRQQFKQRMYRSKSGTVNRKNGFSINEVMISAFVLSVGLVTVVSLFAKGVVNSGADRNRIVAADLAQEGLEIVKNIRDNNFARGDNGFVPFDSLIVGNKDTCGLDYTDIQFITTGVGRNCFGNAGSNVERRFSLVPSGAYFSNPFSSPGTNEQFGRMVYIDYNSGAPSASVISMVWWGGSGVIPSGVLDVSSNPTVVSNCTAIKRCVYSQMSLELWKP